MSAARSVLRPLLCALGLVVLLGGCGDVARPGEAAVNGGSVPPIPPQPRCAAVPALAQGQHLVTSWRTAPGDALITHLLSGMTVRQAFAPHRSGSQMRLRLSNRYSQAPVTIENLHIALEQSRGAAALVPDSSCPLTFAGRRRVTIAAGESVVSDLIHYPVNAFERLAVSFYAPTAVVQLTRHLIANETLYISGPGDYSADPSGAAFVPMPNSYTNNFLIIEALEIAAPRTVTTLVAVGDSITDGSDSTTAPLQGGASAMTGRDERYPNHLQRRLDAAGLPLTVANAGLGGNELLGAGLLPQFGQGLLDRLETDVLSVTGASHVLAMIGTNDIGNAPPGQLPTAEALVAGYTRLIERVQDAGLKIVLGTIPPAEGTVIEGLPIPIVNQLPFGVQHGTAEARQTRDAVNQWIRSQTLSDGIVDFDACLTDPERPGYLNPAFNSGDNLHPNPQGYAAMADCVDLRLFR